MPTYQFTCGNGHAPFDVVCSPEQFVEEEHRCPVCDKPGKRMMFGAGVASGTIVPGCRVPYPIRDFQLPVANDGSYRGGDTVVESLRDHKEKAKRAGYELNQL